MAEYYGFSRVSVRVLKSDLTPDTTKKIHVLEGEATKGAPTSFALTGLTKEAAATFGGNKEYFSSSKGTGKVAANFGLLDVPNLVEREILGLTTFGENIQGFGDKTEAPYVAAFAETEDLTGEPVAFAVFAGKFNRDGYSFATTDDDDFKPEAGEYVINAVSRKVTIKSETGTVKVLSAYGATDVAALKEAALGAEVPKG